MNTMLLKDIRPFVRHARIFCADAYSDRFKNVMAYDRRLIFTTKGSGSITIDDKDYPAKKGCLFLFPAGVNYSYNPGLTEGLTFIAISFDLSFSNSDKAPFPIPPVKKDSFEPKNILSLKKISDFPELDSVIYLKNVFGYENPLTDIVYEYENRLNCFNEKMSGMLTSILCDLVRASSPLSKVCDYKTIQSILELIRENYSKRISNTDIGNILGYHPNYINRIMIKATGYSLHDYLINYRISRAINLINTTNLSITEIADKTGFNGVAHFSACFKQKTGFTPSSYRKGF